MHKKVDAFLADAPKWQKEYAKLRKLAVASGLEESFKWGWPCYALDGGNVVLIHGFKDYCALLFFKGALLKDPKNILIRQSQNVQAGRQVRFTNAKEIDAVAPAIKALIREAMAVEKAGLKVAKKKTKDFPVPDELRKQFARNRAFKSAFAALTPGRQRAYLLHFAAAKQSETRTARIAKFKPKILAGKGMLD